MSLEEEIFNKRLEIAYDFYFALQFVLSVLYEIVTALMLVFGIKIIGDFIGTELKFLGWPVHDIALIFETLVLLGFFISSVINHFDHMFRRQIEWLKQCFQRRWGST